MSISMVMYSYLLTVYILIVQYSGLCVNFSKFSMEFSMKFAPGENFTKIYIFSHEHGQNAF